MKKSIKTDRFHPYGDSEKNEDKEAEKPTTPAPIAPETKSLDETLSLLTKEHEKPLPPPVNPVSKVVHVRNMAPNMTKEDVMELAAPFGPIANVVVMRGKNQALIQMQQITSAIAMIEFYKNNHAQIKGKRVHLGFSRHQELAASSNPTPTVNRVLLVTLHTAHQIPLFPYCINVDVVRQIFSPHGFVEKVVIVNKSQENKDLQSLVQYNTVEGACQALHWLNGQTLYLGTETVIPITLEIQFSNLQQLTVKQNTDKSKDYASTLYLTTPAPAVAALPAAMYQTLAIPALLPPGTAGVDLSHLQQNPQGLL